MKALLWATAACVALAGCSAPQTGVESAPIAEASVSSEEARIDDLVSRMSVEHKVAQLIQPQINSFTAEDMRRYRFGSYLNGGNGGPYGDEYAEASEWLKLADEMYLASVEPIEGGEPVIGRHQGTGVQGVPLDLAGHAGNPRGLLPGHLGEGADVEGLGIRQQVGRGGQGQHVRHARHRLQRLRHGFHGGQAFGAEDCGQAYRQQQAIGIPEGLVEPAEGYLPGVIVRQQALKRGVHPQSQLAAAKVHQADGSHHCHHQHGGNDRPCVVYQAGE